LNALTKLEMLISNSQSASLPVPRVFLPELEPWIQALSLRRLGDPLVSSQTYTLYDLLAGGSQKIVLIGKSGSGKTCTMQAIAYTLLTQDAQAGYCAWIPLRSYAHSLKSTIKNSIGWDELPEEKVLRALEEHKAVLLLDGLNEVAPEEQRRQCAAEIEQLIRSYQGRLFVSYPITDHNFDFDCPAYEILPLSESQFRQIVEAFFAEVGQANKVKWFFDRVTGRSEQVSRDFFSLAQTPLNLRFLLELASTDGFGRDSLRNLYGRVIEKRLKWAELQGKSGQIPVGTKFDCLVDLAFRSVVEDRSLRMSKASVRESFSNHLTTVESAQALDEIIRSGLLLERNDHVEWFHPSMRDYLAGHRLFVLAEARESLDQFPLEEPRGIAAAAYAVGLSTSPSVELTKRPNVFLALLQKQPTFDAVRAAVAEYHLSNMMGDCTDWECAKAEYKELRWGERFLDAYQQIAAIARREKFSGVAQVPSPQGLKVLFNSTADFCLVIFSSANEIGFGQLEGFDAEVMHMARQEKSCAGFCLHGHLLPTLDPEIIAYLQVGVWLRFVSSAGDKERLSKWHEDLSAYGAVTPDSWTNWCKLSEPPEPKSGVITWSKRLLLSWREFYAPVTFQVDLVETPSRPAVFSNRLGQVVIGIRPAHRISLALLMPWTPNILQLDLGTSVFVPFPVPLLNRYYSVYSINWSYVRGSNRPTFVHLRG